MPQTPSICNAVHCMEIRNQNTPKLKQITTLGITIIGPLMYSIHEKAVYGSPFKIHLKPIDTEAQPTTSPKNIR